MTSDATTTGRSLTELHALARTLKARLRIGQEAIAIQAGTLETLTSNARQARDHRSARRSRDNLVYAHGARAEVLGYLQVDDYAVLGLEANGLVHALWVARAALAGPAGTYGDLLKVILSDPDRVAWCRAEGARVAWQHAKAARDAETEAFKRRLATGKLGNWRPLPVTEAQHYQITIICVRGGFEAPTGLRRGSAYDWIQVRGGHPDFWHPPHAAPEWRDRNPFR